MNVPMPALLGFASSTLQAPRLLRLERFEVSSTITVATLLP